jgi:hypothetical protein
LLVTRAQTAFYAGRPEIAWQHVVAAWPGVSAAFLDKLACSRDELLQLRAHAAIALAQSLAPGEDAPGLRHRRLDRKGLLKLAESDAAAIASHRLPQCAPFAALIRASAARVEGDLGTAEGQLRAAEAGFDRAGMALYREVCRYSRLRLEKPDAEPSAPSWFTEQGVAEPSKLARALAPAL